MFKEVKAGKLSIAHRRKVFGVGINDADYKTALFKGKKIIDRCPIYVLWSAMMARCYSARFQKLKPTYIGCTVCDEWVSFSAFKKWVESQPDWEGNELDKDILIEDNKVYSPGTCVFVSKKVNTLLNKNESRRGEYPLGVSVCQDNPNRYRSTCRSDGKAIYLGRFDTPIEAALAYTQYKNSEIRRVANLQTSKIVRDALFRIAKNNHVEIAL